MSFLAYAYGTSVANVRYDVWPRTSGRAFETEIFPAGGFGNGDGDGTGAGVVVGAGVGVADGSAGVEDAAGKEAEVEVGARI